jgi:autophagy-related protein 9
MYCFINPIFVKDYKYDRDFLYNKHKFNRIIKKRLLSVSIINFLFMPILLPFMFLRNLFKYGEKFYNNPGLISSRHWNHYAKWKFRNYNELYHEFHQKILDSYPIAIEYSSQFPIKIIATITDFFIFSLSSFFIVLIIISVINEKVLTNLYMVQSKNLLWFLGITGTLIAVMRKTIKEKIVYNADEKLKILKEQINCINEITIKDKKHSDYFFNLYEYHFLSFIKDVIYTILTPFQLFKLYYKSDDIVEFLSEITVNNPQLGHTNIYSIFTTSTTDIKTLYSRETFCKNNESYE